MTGAQPRAVGWVHNARDLGGLPAGTGRTRPGRVYRSPHLDDLDAAGWSALADAGVRTIIDLRNADEVSGAAVPSSFTRVWQPVEDQSDASFMASWGERLDSPAYYATVLELWPSMVVAVLRAVADAPAGGVVVHCAGGRDRTGMVVAMLLDLVRVPADVIVDDYSISLGALNEHYAASVAPREPVLDQAALERRLAVAAVELRAFLAGLDVAAFLAAHGMSDDEITRLRARLLD